jgi:response regulator RpfG family c-di-GMP phosphodiesterase
MPDERAVMQQHATIGAELLSGSRSPLVQMAEVIALNEIRDQSGRQFEPELTALFLALAPDRPRTAGQRHPLDERMHERLSVAYDTRLFDCAGRRAMPMLAA